ncbi:MAG: hypothetical protein JHC94_04875 [Acidimicrobiia bacterium]|uniref:Unannotated protein n=1 Tax=freshwater metagenome TaxID=449393 RepID=A0A6J7K153_9ZZZZ|nr:hypothetical protein [Acidimicrobiia bacterium]MBJ7513637.1 hypothetical protein [Acidimicrobiia bacterium]MSW27618.1 hypothetical protein [Actinomycetota bacterium]
MRDPGTPRRNPFFEHTFDESQDDVVAFVGAPDEKVEPHLHALGDLSGADSAGGGEAFGEWGDDLGEGWGDDWFETMDGSGESRRSSDALGGIASLVSALAEAQPEAVEHLVTAAHEVVLAVKTVVDAAEQALAQQRSDLADQRQERESHFSENDGDGEAESGQQNDSLRVDPMDEPFSSERLPRPVDLG